MTGSRMGSSNCAVVALSLFALLLTQGSVDVVDARRNQGSNQRKTSSSSSSNGHVTQPSYSTNGHAAGNSHADVAKLSYPNYNSQPNRPNVNANANPASAPAPQAGWNVPQGPPPAYSASNPVGGARPNVHEQAPSYHAPSYGAAPPSYGAAPPSYGAATSNVHQPITATQNHGTQYAGAPPGATYYPSGGHNGYPSNLPAGATYYPSSGHMPMGGGYQPAAAPPGATYYQAGSALPPGATYYSQPPQQSSSGLGFGTGLLAGGLGGALLGHALTPSGGSSSQPAAAAAPAAAGQDRIIIINNGVPVNASDGTTVINAAGVAAAAPAPMNTTQDAQPAAMPAPMAPFSPETSNMTVPNSADAAAAPPPPGGIICVPTKVNETDPADSTKMIEVEKIACYPAPPPPAAAPGEGPAPLAPMAAAQPGSQQVQTPPAASSSMDAALKSSTSGASLLAPGGSLGLLLVAVGALAMRLTAPELSNSF
ncbi:protein transport protein SEC31 [Drosophila pseudoobscura]|uniref:Protein transport protein SEC31 n=1 Tax=Drosophila pseudoobscura pseudoobscura TaxID=46245 RepID=Q29GU2_DROPS|nr:protein transport protein SEC31 [Drosophila pseudoobscura]